TVGNRVAWEREYMLNIVPDEDQVIEPAWIKYYDKLPDMNYTNEYLCSYISVDLAISQNTTADYTAIVVIHAYGNDPKNRKYYIDKRFINKRLSHMVTLEAIQSIYSSQLRTDYKQRLVLIENVQYQAAVVEQLKHVGIDAMGVKIYTDKRARLTLASSLFEQGRVLFPKDESIKTIIEQLVHFGVEKHDDLADAMSMGLNFIQTLPQPNKYSVRS
ncbi:MAG TPA: phage terminase large subunit, partial [Candidatus Saccharibacteria bacterium]|nr:phage terminase large subunit [Candidatus Saccharibacteria bacterium]